MHFIGAESVILWEGKEYRLSRYSLRLWLEWASWADAMIPDPIFLAAGYIDSFPLPDLLADQADNLASVRRSFQDPALYELWGKPEGIKHSFRLLFRQYHPLADPDPLFHGLGLERCNYLVNVAMGFPPVNYLDVERDYWRELGWLPPDIPPTRFIPDDWVAIFKNLFENFSITPAAASELTLTEIRILCKGREEDPIETACNQRQFYAKMTPRQKLELAARKYP